MIDKVSPIIKILQALDLMTSKGEIIIGTVKAQYVITNKVEIATIGWWRLA